MSVDILMYKVHRITQDELNELQNKDAYDVDELNGFEIRTYSLEEMSKNPTRFEQVKDYMQTVELMQTTTDYKACAIANGMPANVYSYSYTILSNKVVFLFDGCEMDVMRDDLDKFTTTTKKMFGVLKRERLDVDVDSWIARTLMETLESEFDNGQDVDLSYTPIHLNAQIYDKLCKILVDLYDKDELYPNADLAKFMIELMRVMCHSDDVFIEFQD